MQAVQPLPGSGSVIEFPALSAAKSERWLVGAHIIVAMVAVVVGSLLGPFQAFRRAPTLQWEIPIFSYYYQALSLHGVLNALVFTTFFIVGISYFVTQRSLQRTLPSPTVAWVSFAMMLVGLLMAGWALISGEANVLYTFYAPMIAHPLFYLGLTLVVVGSWIAGALIFTSYYQWKRENPGEAVPLAVFGTTANFIMWIMCTLGVAIEILFFLLPLSLGWVATTDPQVTRILFWFMGHPLVYFWLLPAYVAWYTMMPKHNGVTLFSDNFARIAFLMLMIFSIPIGVHHLFADPGVSEFAKIAHTFLTFVVATPSLLTAFNIAATLEKAGRKNGATGTLGWITRQKWNDPVMAGLLCGMLIFVVGGITGMMNASFNINIALHNTSWVPGHFHTTLGGGVFLSYIAMLYWLMPILRGRKLFSKEIALAQIYTWFIGIAVFGLAMGRAGMEGAPRRTDLGAAGVYVSSAWGLPLNLAAIGGFILLASLVLLIINLVGTMWFSKGEPTEPAPIETTGPKDTLLVFERWWLWIIIIIVLCVIMWGPVLIQGLNYSSGFWSTAFQMR
ncbi:MAG: cbb3-type cytochrome c oxidase subunit I [Chloroflexota bacterium]|nr:cbb3-type cytochrome c oxidase subunit I [Chloroflexota bacterium]